MADDMVKDQIYTIPLRDVKRVPAWKRANRAVTEEKYLTRHMKVDPVQVKRTTSNERSGKEAVRSLSLHRSEL